MARISSSPSTLLASLHNTQSLSILRTRDFVFNDAQSSPSKRESDVSTADGSTNATPASLEADLAHYRDLFSKLRFSYIEQVTKEKFLRVITSSPPMLVDPAENSELERELAEQKAALQRQKADVAAQIGRIGDAVRSLVARYEAARRRMAELEALPREIGELEVELEALRQSEASHQAQDGEQEREPHLRLPLDETLEILTDREAQNQLLDDEINALRASLPKKRAELEKIYRALKPLEQQKMSTVAAAKNARKRREDGGMDDMEAKGRWYGATGRALEAWLEA